MIGQRVESAPSASPGAVVLLFLAAALGAALLATRPRGWSAEFTPNGLETAEPPQSVAYEQIEGITTGRKPKDPTLPARRRSYAITVVHGAGVLRIPARLNVASEDVYRFLLDRIPATGSRDVNPALADYLRRQVETFGEERVWSYRARSRRKWGRSGRRTAVAVAVLLTGVVWMLAAFRGEAFVVWTGVGVWLVLGAVLYGMSGLGREHSRRPGGRKGREASLVISPPGLALIQGKLTGELRWDEVRAVRYRPQRRNLEINVVAASEVGIVLTLEGATIAIADVYDRPLPVIYERVRQYWRAS